MVLSAPSGGGKTTLCRQLLSTVENVEFSISHTTRPPRGRERDGFDYHFVDDGAFDALVAEGAFLEWAHVHGRRYGTSRREVEGCLGRGVDILFDIDVQGGRQIRRRIDDAVLVFILPPDSVTLEKRLRGRGSDAADEIERRLVTAQKEIAAAADLYTHWIVNDDLQRAASELEAILRGERLARVDRRELVKEFLGGGAI